MRRILIVIILLFSGMRSSAQDPNFSQFFHNPVYYNPAATALDNGLRARANYRNLWGPIPGKFNTLTVSIDAEAVNKTGLGLLVMTNNEGEGKLKTFQAGGMYSYRPVETRNFRMQFGFGASFVQKNIDWSQFTFSDQMDEVFGVVNSTSFVAPSTDKVLYPDFNAGVTLRFNSGRVEARNGKMTSTIGFSVHHLTQPRDAFISDKGRLRMRWVAHANSNILSYNGVVYAPGVIYEKQAELSTFQAGLNMYKYPIYAGFWFRNRSYAMSFRSYDSFIFNLGMNLQTVHSRRIKICYSYDFTVSRLKTASMGTNEVSVVFEFDDVVTFRGIEQKSRKKQKTRFKECVEF